MGASSTGLGIAAGLVLLVGGGAARAASLETPSLPYIDKGACPFECCTYRAWTTNAPVDVRAKPDAKSPLVFHLNKNIPVTGVTGETITDKYGVTHMTQAEKIGYDQKTKKPLLNLRPGDTIYPLHYAGEGSVFFWFKGQTYEEILDDGSSRDASKPHYVWWVNIKTKDGKSGWTDQTKRFDGTDSCS